MLGNAYGAIPPLSDSELSPENERTGADSNQVLDGTHSYLSTFSVATQSSFPTRELLVNLKKWNFRTHVVIGQSSNHITSSR